MVLGCGFRLWLVAFGFLILVMAGNWVVILVMVGGFWGDRGMGILFGFLGIFGKKLGRRFSGFWKKYFCMNNVHTLFIRLRKREKNGEKWAFLYEQCAYNVCTMFIRCGKMEKRKMIRRA